MPWSSEAVIAETVIIEGPSGGTFSYDASGNLRTANVAQTTTDPQQGITCYAGFSTFNAQGAVISLFSSTLDAQLWYADTGSVTQGRLLASVASASSTDPFGNAFQSPGFFSYIDDSSSNFYDAQYAAALISGNGIAAMQLNHAATAGGTKTTVGGMYLLSAAGANAQALVTNSSVLALLTSALLEVQGNIAYGGTTAGTIATAGTDASGYPTITDAAGLSLNQSGCNLAVNAINNVTGAGFANLASFTIHAGDAEVGAVYEVECGGYGVMGNPVTTLTLQARFGGSPGAATDVVGVAAALSFAGSFAAGDLFQWSARVRAVCVTSGSTATWRIYLTGTITDTTQAAISSGDTISFAVGTGAAPGNDITRDSTAAIVMGLSAKWASAANSASISKSSSQFGRRA